MSQNIPDDMILAPISTDVFDRSFLWRYRAQVLRVIDGDTVVLLADTGFHGRHEVNVRIADLNAPELNEPGGQAARVRLVTALGWLTVGWPLRVVTRQRETVVSEVRSFERYVADLFVMEEGKLVNVREVL
jgi:endonuclease YncB( thermonuclease family)